MDIEEYGLALLKAGSNIDNMGMDDIVKNDMKEFMVGRYRVSISQCPVLDKNQLFQHKEKKQVVPPLSEAAKILGA